VYFYSCAFSDVIYKVGWFTTGFFWGVPLSKKGVSVSSAF
jgi:hypothetical protein